MLKSANISSVWKIVTLLAAFSLLGWLRQPGSRAFCSAESHPGQRRAGQAHPGRLHDPA